MGRGRSPLKRAMNLKPLAFNALRLTIGRSAWLSRLTGFFPYISPPAGSRVRILEDSKHLPALYSPAFDEARRICEASNVDVRQGSGPDRSDDRVVQRFVAVIEDVLVPGHRVLPIDGVTGRQIAFDGARTSNWSNARPAPVALSRHIVRDRLVLSLPPTRHYAHHLTDLVFPYYFALQKIGFSEGRAVTVVTVDVPDLLTQAFVRSLAPLGYDVTHHRATITQTISARRYLYARGLASNREHEFAVPEAIDYARQALLAALPGQEHDEPAPERLYLWRGQRRMRQVVHEAQLIEKLRGHGFTVFEAKWDNIRRQIAWFSACDVVAGIHGAGLVNMLWAKPEALLVELQAGNARKTTGLHWAAEASASYATVLGGNEGLKQSFALDPDTALAAILAEIDAHAKVSGRGCESLGVGR